MYIGNSICELSSVEIKHINGGGKKGGLLATLYSVGSETGNVLTPAFKLIETLFGIDHDTIKKGFLIYCCLQATHYIVGIAITMPFPLTTFVSGAVLLYYGYAAGLKKQKSKGS